MLNARVNRFRSSFTAKEGFTAAQVVQCQVVDVNLTNWTVDCISQFDRKKYFNIQVSSPYMHYSNGEGIYTVPEVGAVCMVCIPSDSSPMFVLSFVMPHAAINTATEDAPEGTTGQKGAPQKYATDATFSGGRPVPKPGDIILKNRDNNFVILHRGGVLQIGATELSQRVFIPLNNLIMDISGNYAHHNTGGTILWGVQEGPSENSPPCLYTHNFRVRANDAEADVRVRVGEVRAPIGEPPGDAGDTEDLAGLEIGDDPKDNPIICEVAVANKGFNTGTGEPATATVFKDTVLRFFFDRKGGTFLRCKGSLLVSSKSKIKIKALDSISIEGKSFDLTLNDGADINGGAYTHIKGDIVRLGQGAAPVARQGDIVTVVIPPSIIPVQGIVGGPPGPAASGAPVTGFVLGGQLVGTITSGNSRVLG